MRLISIVGSMLALVWWEWPNLKRWGTGERWAFWVAWAVVAAWAIGEQLRLPFPSLGRMQVAWVMPLAKKLLKPTPNPFW